MTVLTSPKMYFQIGFLLSFALFQPILAGLVPRREELERRDDVVAAKAILVILQASAFCSSIVPITDSTQTVTTDNGMPVTVTSTAPTKSCTIYVTGTKTSVTTVSTSTATTVVSTTTDTITFILLKRASVSSTSTPISTDTTKSAAVAVTSNTPKTGATTITSATTPTSSAAATLNALRASTSPTTTSPNAATKCSIRGIPSSAQIFACDVIKQACLLFVKPKTKTTTVTATSTKTTVSTPVASTCETVQASVTVTSSVTATTTTSKTLTTSTTVTVPNTPAQPTPTQCDPDAGCIGGNDCSCDPDPNGNYYCTDNSQFTTGCSRNSQCQASEFCDYYDGRNQHCAKSGVCTAAPLKRDLSGRSDSGSLFNRISSKPRQLRRS